MKRLNRNLTSIASCSLVFAAAHGGWAQQLHKAPAAPPGQSGLETPRQLQQLVAPIALYPDALVGEILAAATYPDQIVEADYWMQHHPGLAGLALAQAVNQQPWDPSTKSLTQFPKVLANMDANLGWTSSLGDDYVNQQPDVLAAVQALRQRASASGNLQTNEQQTVTGLGPALSIQPTNPQNVYVPQYNPSSVYGASMAMYPGWQASPGLYMSGMGINFGQGFGSNYFGGSGFGWNSWGVDWGGHNVTVNQAVFTSRTPTFIKRPIMYPGNPGRIVPLPMVQGRAGLASARSGSNVYRGATRYGGSGARSSAFSSYNHGGVVRSNSYRGKASYGGGYRSGGFNAGGGARMGGGRRR